VVADKYYTPLKIFKYMNYKIFFWYILKSQPPYTSHPVLWRVIEINSYPFKENYGGESPGVYYLRLQRDGWKLLERKVIRKWHVVNIFENPIDNYWKLRKIAHSTSEFPHPLGKGCYYDEHQLLNTKTDETVDYADWEWAEVDGERLVWATKGKIFSGRVTQSKFEVQKELYDFNNMCFEPIKAPY
jgi:hypothetical protein